MREEKELSLSFSYSPFALVSVLTGHTTFFSYILPFVTIYCSIEVSLMAIVRHRRDEKQ